MACISLNIRCKEIRECPKCEGPMYLYDIIEGDTETGEVWICDDCAHEYQDEPREFYFDD